MSQTKEHILKTAFGLFLQKSYKEVTMKEIVEKTGLSKGAFYHYFKSKEELFFEVIDSFYFNSLTIDFKKFRHDTIKNFYTDYALHTQKNFKELINYLLPSDAYSNININFITILFDAINIFPGFREKLMKALSDELKEWTAIVKKTRKKGEFTSPMTDEQIARMFIYSNDGIALRLLLEGRLDSIYTEMITLWDNFYEEVKN
jgi:TetR/AcrR family transcriptional repressor of nem operon